MRLFFILLSVIMFIGCSNSSSDSNYSLSDSEKTAILQIEETDFSF